MKSKIKVFAIIISVFTMIALMCPVLAVSADDTLVISTSKAEGKRGDTVEVTLTVDSNPGFAAMLINIPVTSGFEVVEVKNGNVMRSMTPGKNILWDSDSNSTATGTLLTVTLLITDSAEFGETVINVKMIECFNDTFGAVTVSIEPIVINVLGEESEEESTTSEVESESLTEYDESNTETITEDVIEDNSEETTTEKNEENESTSEKKEPLDEDADNKPSSNNGCRLSVSGLAVVIAIIPSIIAFASKKRR